MILSVGCRGRLDVGRGRPLTTTLYPCASAWVEDYLSMVYWRRLGTRHVWCPQWWDHPEAVMRIEGMWRAWEQMRKADAALDIAAWFTEVATR